jgi:hypothetical protein
MEARIDQWGRFVYCFVVLRIVFKARNLQLLFLFF